MKIQTAKLTSSGYLVTLVGDSTAYNVPNASGNRHYEAVQEWIGLGNTPDPADPPPAPPTNDEIYDQVMQQQAVLKAFALCINDGSIVPGANISAADLKAAVKANM